MEFPRRGSDGVAALCPERRQRRGGSDLQPRSSGALARLGGTGFVPRVLGLESDADQPRQDGRSSSRRAPHRGCRTPRCLRRPGDCLPAECSARPASASRRRGGWGSRLLGQVDPRRPVVPQEPTADPGGVAHRRQRHGLRHANCAVSGFRNRSARRRRVHGRPLVRGPGSGGGGRGVHLWLGAAGRAPGPGSVSGRARLGHRDRRLRFHDVDCRRLRSPRLCRSRRRRIRDLPAIHDPDVDARLIEGSPHLHPHDGGRRRATPR